LTDVLPFSELSPFIRVAQEGSMAHDDRIDPTELADIERLAKEALQGGLLEQAWARRALALVREVRTLRERLAAVEDQDS
jgi:hypothetical protein